MKNKKQTLVKATIPIKLNKVALTNVLPTEISWYINGYDSYAFGRDKKLYNLKTNKEVKEVCNSGCFGFWLDRNFISKTKLKPLLQKTKSTDIYQKNNLILALEKLIPLS